MDPTKCVTRLIKEPIHELLGILQLPTGHFLAHLSPYLLYPVSDTVHTAQAANSGMWLVSTCRKAVLAQICGSWRDHKIEL